MKKQHARFVFLLGGLMVGLMGGHVAQAEPSSQVVWDSATRHIVGSGNAVRGAANAEVCDSCHASAPGKSLRANFPRLAGQNPFYVYKQLMDYRANTRGHGVMQNFASQLTPAKMADLAAYYADQDLPGRPARQASPEVLRLVYRGDARRLIPPCAACHGRYGEGALVHVPALAGQEVSYFTTTMQAYKSGERANDLYSRMRYIAGQLTDGEIEALARYYAGTGR